MQQLMNKVEQAVDQAIEWRLILLGESEERLRQRFYEALKSEDNDVDHHVDELMKKFELVYSDSLCQKLEYFKNVVQNDKNLMNHIGAIANRSIGSSSTTPPSSTPLIRQAYETSPNTRTQLPRQVNHLKHRFEHLLEEINEKRQRLERLRVEATQKSIRDHLAEIKPNLDANVSDLDHRLGDAKKLFSLWNRGVKGDCSEGVEDGNGGEDSIDEFKLIDGVSFEELWKCAAEDNAALEQQLVIPDLVFGPYEQEELVLNDENSVEVRNDQSQVPVEFHHKEKDQELEKTPRLSASHLEHIENNQTIDVINNNKKVPMINQQQQFGVQTRNHRHQRQPSPTAYHGGQLRLASQKCGPRRSSAKLF